MSDLLSISDLSITFDNGPRVVDGLSFSIDKGQTLALVGESGSGKSVSALSILRLLDERHAAYPAGQILYKGEDLLQAKEKRLRQIRGRHISMIFQEPMTSLNPLHTVEKQIGETLELHKGMRGPQARKRCLELLQGRDVAARVIYGFRISVLFGLTLTIASSIVGVAVGALQGYYGGKIDLFGQRFIEIWSGLPMLYLLIILSSIVQPNFWWLLGIMLLFSWMGLVDVVRAEFLRARNFEYVKAARALGLDNRRIMFRHILPNAMVATLTFMPFILTGAITGLTSLDFLGFGLPSGSPSLGELIAQGKANLHAPWLGISAFVSLAVMLTLLVFVGEAVRDAFDPRKN